MHEELEHFHEEADRELERRVAAFLADRNLPALRRLGVRSERGVVTLRGRVRTFYEKQLGHHSARRVAGVIEVIDATEVASDASLFAAAGGRNQPVANSAPAILSFDSYLGDRQPGNRTPGFSAGGLDPISQAKG